MVAGEDLQRIVGCAIIGIVSTALLTDYTNRDISEEYDMVRLAQPAGK